MAKTCDPSADLVKTRYMQCAQENASRSICSFDGRLILIVAHKCPVSLDSIYHHVKYMYTHKPSYIVSAIGLCLRLS